MARRIHFVTHLRRAFFGRGAHEILFGTLTDHTVTLAIPREALPSVIADLQKLELAARADENVVIDFGARKKKTG